MGRRKAFIDKKHATTYSLVCDEGPQQQQAGSVSQGGFASSLFPVEQGVSLSETKREQIVELGLPDDGYDYLQHVRDPAQDGLDSVDGEDGGGGAGGAYASVMWPCRLSMQPKNYLSMRMRAGPRVFLPAPYLEPPPEDVRLFDARALPLPAAPAKQVCTLSSINLQPSVSATNPRLGSAIAHAVAALVQDDALPFSSTVTAFSREIEEQPPKRELWAPLDRPVAAPGEAGALWIVLFPSDTQRFCQCRGAGGACTD